MQRYNMFLQVHKGLRAMLYHVAGLLQQTDFTVPQEAGKAMNLVQEAMVLFDRHAASEDAYVLPAISRYEPGVATLFEKEHVEDHELSHRIDVLINIFRHTSDDTEKAILGGAIRYAFVEFLQFNLRHMAKEEDLLNHLLWKHYNDDSLQEITQRILANKPPELLGKYSRWMIQGLNNAEIIAWFKAVRNNAPGIVLNSLLTTAINELPEHRWEVIREGLLDAAMVA